MHVAKNMLISNCKWRRTCCFYLQVAKKMFYLQVATDMVSMPKRRMNKLMARGMSSSIPTYCRSAKNMQSAASSNVHILDSSSDSLHYLFPVNIVCIQKQSCMSLYRYFRAEISTNAYWGGNYEKEKKKERKFEQN